MKKQQMKSLGVFYSIDVPETAEEFDKLAGSPNACVEEAVKNVSYRQCHHDFREKLCEKAEAESGVPRKTKTTGEGDNAKEVFDEKEQEYINRLLAGDESGPFITDEKLQALATEVEKEIKFDPTPTTRKKAVPKELQANATQLMSAITNGETSADRVAGNFSNELGVDFVETFGEVSQESLEKALVAVAAKEAAARKTRFL